MSIRTFNHLSCANRVPGKRRATHWDKPKVEPLELRRLLSCVIDARLAATGAKSATVTTVGQVLNLEVWAVVTGKDASGSNDGFQSTAGSFLSTTTAIGSVRGNLAAINIAPFNASGAHSGKKQDLNGDGSVDVGTANTGPFADAFNARAGSLSYGGVVSGSGQSFLIARLTYTVTSLASGQATNVNFRRRMAAGEIGAVWSEESTGRSEFTGTFGVGAPFVIKGPTAAGGSIAGTVFADLNGNTTKDAGEAGVSGATVFIDSNNNKTLDTTEKRATTGIAGVYQFSNLAGGAYVLRETLPTGFKQITPTPGTGLSVNLAGGENRTGANFTVLPAGSIAGIVFNDTNGSGQRETGEPVLSGRKIFLDSNKNAKLDSGEPTATTGGSGNFKFSNLLPNTTYRLREALPGGWRVSSPATGYFDVPLSPGQNVTSRIFADTQKVLISGNVFNDINSSGTKTSGEAGLSGWRVYIDLNQDGTWQSNENNKLTDASGMFSFVSLIAGTYRIRVVVPAGYSQTAPPGGAFNATLGNGQILTGRLFGVHKL